MDLEKERRLVGDKLEKMGETNKHMEMLADSWRDWWMGRRV